MCQRIQKIACIVTIHTGTAQHLISREIWVTVCNHRIIQWPCLLSVFYRLAQKYKQMQLHKSAWRNVPLVIKTGIWFGKDTKVQCMKANHIRKFHWAMVASRGLYGLHSPQGGPDQAGLEIKQFKWASNKIIPKMSITSNYQSNLCNKCKFCLMPELFI